MLGGFHKSEPLNRKSSVPELLHNWVIANFRKVKEPITVRFKSQKEISKLSACLHLIFRLFLSTRTTEWVRKIQVPACHWIATDRDHTTRELIVATTLDKCLFR